MNRGSRWVQATAAEVPQMRFAVEDEIDFHGSPEKHQQGQNVRDQNDLIGGWMDGYRSFS